MFVDPRGKNAVEEFLTGSKILEDNYSEFFHQVTKIYGFKNYKNAPCYSERLNKFHTKLLKGIVNEITLDRSDERIIENGGITRHHQIRFHLIREKIDEILFNTTYIGLTKLKITLDEHKYLFDRFLRTYITMHNSIKR